MSRTSAHAAAAAPPWYRTITTEQWRVLAAAKLGWMLDALDFMLYTMALNQLRVYFTFDDAVAGFLGTATLVMSGFGGLIFGWIADRFGRTRALMGTIIVFSLASLGAATSQSVLQLLFWRTVLGIGMGGEWASGAVLVSETWPAHLRNKAISIVQSGWAIGYIMAAVFAALILGSARFGNEGWRWLFLVGLAPALATLWIRRNVHEPKGWTARAASRKPRVNPFPVIFGRELLPRTLLIIALGGAVQFAYFGLFFWLPPYLARPVAQGGAGMGGAYFGYLTFGFIADVLGRRRTFVLFMIAAAIIAPIYGKLAATSPIALLVLSPLLGYFGHGYFSMFGGFLAELYPPEVRATGQGTSYNLGRTLGAFGPSTIGVLGSLPGVGLGLAISATSAFFLLASVLVFTLPDRSGQALE
jgi:MFS family permease